MADEDLAPETINAEQEDEEAQAQTVAQEALDRSISVLGSEDSAKLSGSFDPVDAQDLVDHMNQMDRSGIIDMSAYRGERNDDDEDDFLGEHPEE